MTAIDQDGNYDPQGATYARLWSGEPDCAFRTLLGVAGAHSAIPSPTQEPFGAIAIGDLRQLYQVLVGDDDVPPHVPSAVFADLVGHGEVPLFYKSVWKPWATQTGLGDRWRNVYIVRAGQAGVFRQEHFEQFMRDHAQQHASAWGNLLRGWTWMRPRPAQSWANPSPPRSEPRPGYGPGLHLAAQAGYGVWGGPFGAPPAEGPTAKQAVDRVCEWAWQRQHFPRKRGTGIYTAAQLRLHDEIAQHLQAHRPVCLSTRKEVGRTVDPERGYSGEQKSKGLAGRHGYAVTGCFTDDATGLRFVQVFNPWGHTGRGYTFTLTNPSLRQLPTGAAVKSALERKLSGARAATAYATASPVFWLELDDVAKRCAKIYTCGSASSTPDLIVQGRRAAGLST